MKSFIGLGIFLGCIQVLHCVKETRSASTAEVQQNIDSILSFILTKPKPKLREIEATDKITDQSSDTLIKAHSNGESNHLRTSKGEATKCENSDCSDSASSSFEAKEVTRLRKPQGHNGTFLSNAMGVLAVASPTKIAQQNAYRRNKNSTTIPNPKKALMSGKGGSKKPEEQKRKFGAMGQRVHNARKFANAWKQPGEGSHRPNLGKIFPLLSNRGKQSPEARPAPTEHFQPNAIHLMMEPGKGRPKFKLMKSFHKNPEKKQVGNLADILGPHFGAGGLGPLETAPREKPWDDFMGPGLTGGSPDIPGGHEMGQLPIHVNAPNVIHDRPFPQGFTGGANVQPVSDLFGPPPPLSFHRLPAPIPALPLPTHIHHFHAQGLPFPVPAQSPARIEHVGYPIPVPVPGPPEVRPIVIPMRVSSAPRIQRVPFPIPVRMRPQIQHVPFPVPVAVPAHPQIRHIPYPVPIPVKQPPQVEKFFYPVQLPQPLQVHHVPFPVYIHSPPQVKHVPVAVPSPPEKVPVAVPGPTRYMVNRVPFPIIVPRIQNVPFPVPIDLHHHDDDNFENVLITGQCLVSPCLNGGTCTAHLDTYRCHCTSGYKGLHCEEQVSCEPNPCKNFGTCTEIEKGFECTCKKGYTGKYCSRADPCYPSPCSNGGTCVQSGNSYSCSCRLGWMGKNCEVESKCLPLNPCQNGGTCSEGNGSYKCDCTPGWKGISCEITAPETVVDDIEQPEACAACHVHAICSRGRCLCRPGYVGDGLSCHVTPYH